MEKQEAVIELGKNRRNSIAPEFAKELVEAFGLEWDEKLAYTKLRYRESVAEPELPRVAVYELAEFICEKLGLELDKEKLKEASTYFGEGRRVQAVTEASLLPLMRKFKVKGIEFY